jgi:hypothetical protein
MSALQTYIGSAFASYPVRWIQSTESARQSSASAETQNDKKVYDPDAEKPQSASGDVLDLSSDAQKIADNKKVENKADYSGNKSEIELNHSQTSLKAEKSEQSEQAAKSATVAKELTEAEQKQVDELKARDQEVRTHEAAHLAAAGGYATGGPTYTYQTGPDGKKYAIGGEVSVSTAEVKGDPQATIEKMQTVAAAALAPAEPSGQDRKVAAAARQTEAKARMELARQRSEGLQGNLGNAKNSEETSGTQLASSESKVESSGKELPELAKDEDGKASQSISISKNSSPQNASATGIASSLTPAASYWSRSSQALSSPGFTAFA